MAKLFLTGSEEMTAGLLSAVLSERLSSKYGVFVCQQGESHQSRAVKVRKDAFMAIVAWPRPKPGGVEFMTMYEPGSLLLVTPLYLLLIPIIYFWRLSRSPARYELEADVIEALRDEWPELTEQY